MRVLSVSNFFDTHGGGLERVAGNLSREFALAGHDAVWAASDADGLPDNPAQLIGLRCVNPTERLTGLPMPLPGPASIFKLAKNISESDAVVIHDALYATSILAMLLARRKRKPVILIQHIASIKFAHPLLRGLVQLANAIVTRPMIAATDRLVFISQTVREELLGIPPRRTSLLVFNGVDQNIFNRSEREPRNATRTRWGLSESRLLVIFVGRFVEKKGLSIIRALAASRPDVEFALVGKGPINPTEWNLDNVKVLGQQPQDVVADLYRTGDVLLLPSVGEGYPLVIQEAMSCGLPAICGKGSAHADPACTKWLSGVGIDLGDPLGSAARCSEALDRLVKSPIDAAAMARYAAETYSWKRMADAVLKGIAAPAERAFVK